MPWPGNSCLSIPHRRVSLFSSSLPIRCTRFIVSRVRQRVIEAMADVMVMKKVFLSILAPTTVPSSSPSSTEMAGWHGSKNGIYRARKPTGERLLCEFQLETAERVPQRRTLPLNEGNQSAGGTVASSLQHRPATLLAGLQTTGARDVGGKGLGCEK
jgi:hypothetical protein